MREMPEDYIYDPYKPVNFTETCRVARNTGTSTHAQSAKTGCISLSLEGLVPVEMSKNFLGCRDLAGVGGFREDLRGCI